MQGFRFPSIAVQALVNANSSPETVHRAAVQHRGGLAARADVQLPTTFFLSAATYHRDPYLKKFLSKVSIHSSTETWRARASCTAGCRTSSLIDAHLSVCPHTFVAGCCSALCHIYYPGSPSSDSRCAPPQRMHCPLVQHSPTRVAAGNHSTSGGASEWASGGTMSERSAALGRQE